jgi:hypothetical protein
MKSALKPYRARKPAAFDARHRNGGAKFRKTAAHFLRPLHDIVTVIANSAFGRCNHSCAAMVAPHLLGLLVLQSDLGHPAGAVLPTKSLWTPPKSGLWRESQTLHAACGDANASSLTSEMN